jgi:hypothetical protein
MGRRSLNGILCREVDVAPTRDQLLALGYGFGYSSFPENGLAVKEGAQRTRQVEAKFTSEFARPDRTYLMGPFPRRRRGADARLNPLRPPRPAG